MKILLNGEIVSDGISWLYNWLGISCCHPSKLRREIAELSADEPIELVFNSGGGSVFAGFEMYGIIKDLEASGRKVTGQVQSLAGSAASIMLAACSHVQIYPVAQVMIHLPSSIAAGTHHDMESAAAALRSITDGALNAYELRCAGKTTRAELLTMMEKDSWMHAQDAIKHGFADEVIYADQMAADVQMQLGQSVQFVASAGVFDSDYNSLLKRYEAAVLAGAEADPLHPVAAPAAETQAAASEGAQGGVPAQSLAISEDWKHEAALALERERFKY